MRVRLDSVALAAFVRHKKVCVFVCVCVRACARACVRSRVWVRSWAGACAYVGAFLRVNVRIFEPLLWNPTGRVIASGTPQWDSKESHWGGLPGGAILCPITTNCLQHRRKYKVARLCYSDISDKSLIPGVWLHGHSTF